MSEKNPFFGATFAERKAARLAAETKPVEVEPKQVDAESDEVEDKAMRPTETKRRTSRKRS